MIGLQYDSIYRTPPDPVWWFSGSPAFAETFVNGFLTHFKQLNEKERFQDKTGPGYFPCALFFGGGQRVHDRVPTDATRTTVLTTGAYSARLNYRVFYKTNYRTGYQVSASNLRTSSNYSFNLNAIPTQAGEYVTGAFFDIGKVPVGFQSTINPTLTVQVLGAVANNYQITNRADVGCKYQGTWKTAQAIWLTIVGKLTPTYVPTLPKTGY